MEALGPAEDWNSLLASVGALEGAAFYRVEWARRIHRHGCASMRRAVRNRPHRRSIVAMRPSRMS